MCVFEKISIEKGKPNKRYRNTNYNHNIKWILQNSYKKFRSYNLEKRIKYFQNKQDG